MAPPKQKKDGPLLIQGYTVIQVRASSRSHSAQCMYLREHISTHAKTEWPTGRTLLVHNVPAYCNEENLKAVFYNCGGINRVHLQHKTSSAPLDKASPFTFSSGTTCLVAYVVFKKLGGVKNACKLPYNNVLQLSNSKVPVVAGLRAYIKEYEESLVDVPALEKVAEEYMANYYKKQEEDELLEKEQEGVPDEDGFIKVTRHGKSKGGKRTEENEKKGHDHIRSRKKKNELKDFYTFQFRETKRKHIAELQAKFEEDKQKVQQMKMARKFRPY